MCNNICIQRMFKRRRQPRTTSRRRHHDTLDTFCEYLCENARGIKSNGKKMQYKVNVKFTPERNLKSYVTTLTAPNEIWAESFDGSLQEDCYQIYYLIGLMPELKLKDNVITLKAITRSDITDPTILEYTQEVTEEQVIDILKVIDLKNSTPFLKMFI